MLFTAKDEDSTCVFEIIITKYQNEGVGYNEKKQ